MLRSHFQPKRNVIAERFRFHGRNQMIGESVAQFVAELRRLTARCEFGEYLTEALRDRLVCGLRSEPAQRKLPGEGGALTLQRAIELAQTMESAKEQAQSLHGSSDLSVGRVEQRRQELFAESKACNRCGKQGHLAAAFPFREAKCYKCGEKGYIARVCRGGKKAIGERPKKLHVIDTGVTDHSDDSDSIATVRSLKSRRSNPYKAVVTVNVKPLEMEVDTGAAVSLISKKTLEAMFPAAPISKPSLALRTYTSEPIPVIGEVSVQVQHNGYTGTHQLVVVGGKGPTLLGRDWLKADSHCTLNVT